MATQEVNGATAGMIYKALVERDMDIAEAGEASGDAGRMSGKTTRVTLVAESEQWERNKNGKTLKNKTSETVSTLGDCRSRMVGTVRQQACEVTQLHQSIDRIARMLDVHVVCEEAQWRGMKEWLEDSETKWDERHRDNVLWGMAIPDMATEVVTKARVRDVAPAQRARMEGRDETARQAGGGLEASRHAGVTQDREPEKRLPQQ